MRYLLEAKASILKEMKHSVLQPYSADGDESLSVEFKTD